MPRFSAAQRLDLLPIGGFHRRILFLIGAGMFLDNFNTTLQGGVLGALTASHWSTMGSNARFISATFLGMLIASFCAGILGDRYGRRFAYQINLLIIGLTSFAAAFAPSMEWLIGALLVMGFGLGTELVIGYSTLAEFVPPQLRGRCGLLLVQALAVFLFGIRTENRPLEDLTPDQAPLGMAGAKAVKA
ncbi:MAG TPA: MFS transporter [Bryobacteraceae bacterium]|nr:MFS transporter [Bryobacteraceae bacterium]